MSGLVLVHRHLVSHVAISYLIICFLFSVHVMILAFSDSRRVGSSLSGYRKDEYSWRYDGNDLPEDVMRTSAALENLQLDRKARNLTSSWRYVLTMNKQVVRSSFSLSINFSTVCRFRCRHGGDGIGEDDSRGEHM